MLLQLTVEAGTSPNRASRASSRRLAEVRHSQYNKRQSNVTHLKCGGVGELPFLPIPLQAGMRHSAGEDEQSHPVHDSTRGKAGVGNRRRSPHQPHSSGPNVLCHNHNNLCLSFLDAGDPRSLGACWETAAAVTLLQGGTQGESFTRNACSGVNIAALGRGKSGLGLLAIYTPSAQW